VRADYEYRKELRRKPDLEAMISIAKRGEYQPERMLAIIREEEEKLKRIISELERKNPIQYPMRGYYLEMYRNELKMYRELYTRIMGLVSLYEYNPKSFEALMENRYYQGYVREIKEMVRKILIRSRTRTLEAFIRR
jgi:hypothetical protein